MYKISWLTFLGHPVFNVECNALVDMTLIRPLNKGQGHSFWYNRFLIGLYDFL